MSHLHSLSLPKKTAIGRASPLLYNMYHGCWSTLARLPYFEISVNAHTPWPDVIDRRSSISNKNAIHETSHRATAQRSRHGNPPQAQEFREWSLDIKGQIFLFRIRQGNFRLCVISSHLVWRNALRINTDTFDQRYANAVYFFLLSVLVFWCDYAVKHSHTGVQL